MSDTYNAAISRFDAIIELEPIRLTADPPLWDSDEKRFYPLL